MTKGIVQAHGIIEDGWAHHRAAALAALPVVDSDADALRHARVLISEHGPEALSFAAQRRGELSQVGEIEGEKVWQRIVNAILELKGDKSDV